MIARIYFQWPNGESDEVLLEADTMAEMRKIVDAELRRRNAVYTGSEILEEMK